jgi:hypothetical protein
MSLQLAAQHLADKGRGPDTTLVHMSNKEVKSLNDLAMAHGGQLTINPQTGLPEAGFLSSILPMVAGMALNAYAPGLGSVATGALVGGASYLMNPKAGLMGGLMAGMGAYGGANLGEALAAQGMQASAGIPEAAKGLGALTSESTAAQVAAAREAAEQSAKKFAENQVGYQSGNFMNNVGTMGEGVKSAFTQPGGFSQLGQNLGGGSGMLRTGLAAAAPATALQTPAAAPATGDKDMGQRYTYSANKATPLPAPDVPTYQKQATEQGNFGSEQEYFVRPEFKAVTGEEAKNIYGFAGGGPVEQMSNDNAIGANTGFPQAYLHNNAYATPYQTPISQNVLTGAGDVSVDPYTGEQRMAMGGISDAGYNLGGYSDGGRLLRGPGDGVSDSIPAMIGKKQPARLADGEFVVPARIVSELGNGSTEAGARKLYAMLDRVQSARSKSIGKGKVAKNSRADKYLPA